MKNFDFVNDTSGNVSSHAYISYMENERLQEEQKVHSIRTTLKMLRSHAKSAPRKMIFVLAKAISKSYTPDCSCKCFRTFSHS